jgi:SOS-response transcriptional repressor LexA
MIKCNDMLKHRLHEVMNELTSLQEQCLLSIIACIEANQKPPTRRELQQILGQKSTNGANQILKALMKKGYIRIDPPGKKRNIMVLRKPQNQLPLFSDDRKA